MEIGKTLYLTDRTEWRKWLKENFNIAKEIWLVYPNKTSGKPRILYNNAVEEALCFGWIDSIIKSLDKENAVQRFSPRNPKSKFSQLNIERLRWLDKHKLIHPDITESVRKVIYEEFFYPGDIIDAIKKDPEVWKNYSNFSDSYKRIRIAYIDTARSRTEEFDKRLKYFIKNTRENKLIKSYGGSEKYYL